MKKPKKSPRRAYKAPRVKTDRIYEQYGLACGKANTMIPNCKKNFMS